MQSAFVRRASTLKDAVKALRRQAKSVVRKTGRPEGLEEVHQHLRASRPHAALRSFQNSKTRRPEVADDAIRLFGVHKVPELMLDAFKSHIAAGFRPSSKTWTSLLRSCSIDTEELYELAAGPGILTDDLVAAIMRHHSKDGRPDLCEAIFERYERGLERIGRHPGPIVWKCLIDARGYLGDIYGAKAWFDAWRTSPAHPYGFMEEKRSSRRPSPLRPHPAPNTLYRGVKPFGKWVREDVRYYARTASTMVSYPAPDARPYTALLRHIIDHSRSTRASINFLELMAADRVPLTCSVFNTLIYHEVVRKEASAASSMLAIYEKMQSSISSEHRPNYKTFSMLFENAYPENRRQVGRPCHPALPTQLQRQSGLAPPTFRYTSNPRALLADLVTAHRASCCDADPRIIDAKLLNSAVAAFVRTRDFVGASAAVSAFKHYGIDPNSGTHGGIISGALRAHGLGQGFLTSSGRKWLTRERRIELCKRRERLNDLDGYTRADATDIVEVEPIAQKSGEVSQYLITRPARRDTDPRIWNNRLVPRADWEIRATRRYEMRDVSGLGELLHMASPHAEEPKEVWERRVAAAEGQMQMRRNR